MIAVGCVFVERSPLCDTKWWRDLLAIGSGCEEIGASQQFIHMPLQRTGYPYKTNRPVPKGTGRFGWQIKDLYHAVRLSGDNYFASLTAFTAMKVILPFST